MFLLLLVSESAGTCQVVAYFIFGMCVSFVCGLIQNISSISLASGGHDSNVFSSKDEHALGRAMVKGTMGWGV